MSYMHVPTRTQIPQETYTAPDGSRYPYGILGNYSGLELEAIDLARIVDSVPPDYDPDTQTRSLAPMSEWPIVDGIATKTYIVSALPQDEIDRIAQEKADAAARQARKESFEFDATTVEMLNTIDTLSPAQIEAWVNANTGNLNNPAKAAVSMIIKAMAYLRMV